MANLSPTKRRRSGSLSAIATGQTDGSDRKAGK
jgi:hypothetical protein